MTTPIPLPAARLPSGPRGLPLLGRSLDFTRDPLGFLLETRRRHGDMVRLPFLGFSVCLISNPDLIEKMLVSDHKSYRKDRYIRQLFPVVGQGLLTSEGDFWRRQRRLAQPAFHRERIAAYGAMMVEAAERLLATLAPGQERDLHQDLMGLTLDIVTRTLFSADVGAAGHDVGAALETLMQRFANPLYLSFPWLSRLPLPQNRRFDAAVARIDQIIYGLIRARKAQGGGGDDLLGMLLSARDEDGSAMDERQLRDEVVTVFLAGHETTALALTYTFLLLSQHPAARARLVDELASVLSGRPPTPEDLPQLRYTEAVVLESLRLYPPAWALGREAARDTDLGDCRIPTGMQVWTSQWVVHRDPRFFPDPEAFQPERWLDGLQRRLPRYAYFPFGGGPRLCIGNTFALMETTLLLTTLAQRYHFAVLPGPPLELLPSVTLRPRHGPRVRISRVAAS